MLSVQIFYYDLGSILDQQFSVQSRMWILMNANIEARAGSPYVLFRAISNSKVASHRFGRHGDVTSPWIFSRTAIDDDDDDDDIRRALSAIHSLTTPCIVTSRADSSCLSCCTWDRKRLAFNESDTPSLLPDLFSSFAPSRDT